MRKESGQDDQASFALDIDIVYQVMYARKTVVAVAQLNHNFEICLDGTLFYSKCD